MFYILSTCNIALDFISDYISRLSVVAHALFMYNIDNNYYYSDILRRVKLIILHPLQAGSL